ncbi:MAG: HDOD domain-containing protein [Oleiphilaceae bacterium]|nr:HDOD domain-containing protein [Oleiphilaceae bacterium]
MPPTSESIFATLKTNRLPSLPHVLVEMLEACQGQQASFQEMSQIISRDAAIAARVVALANSSYYNRGRRIDSLERALFMLGTETIKTIVITASIQQFFSGFSSAHSAYLRRFWQQSLSCALIAKSLAILTSYHNADEAYLTGLLHNIGELVLETNFGEEYQRIRESCSDIAMRLETEQNELGMTHPSVGAWLFRQWRLGEFAADALAFHQSPLAEVEDAHHLVKIIYLATCLSHGGEPLSHDAMTAAEALFELNPSLINEISEKISDEVTEVATSLGISFDEALQEDDHHKQIALARQVRNIGLIQSAASEVRQATTALELDRALQSTLDLLFDFRQSLIFWLLPEHNELVLLRDEDNQLRIKLEHSRSLVATAARSKMLHLHSDAEQEAPLPIVDQQLQRMLNAEQLCCIPIATQHKLYCVVVAAQAGPMKLHGHQHQLIQLFAHEIANTCQQTLERVSHSEQNLGVDELMQRVHEIAHEANNPLNIISNYLAALAEKLKKQGETFEELDVVREEIERTSHILFRLKDLQNNEINDTRAELNTEIRALCGLYEQSIFALRNIDCSLQLDAALEACAISRNALRQILTNLLKNAAEAMSDGGTIFVSTSRCVDASGKVLAELRIRDSGQGIPEEVLKNLFSPVASNKGTGHSGLGLSITKNLVTDASGTISCRSNNQGTEFQILLQTIK